MNNLSCNIHTHKHIRHKKYDWLCSQPIKTAIRAMGSPWSIYSLDYFLSNTHRPYLNLSIIIIIIIYRPLSFQSVYLIRSSDFGSSMPCILTNNTQIRIYIFTHRIMLLFLFPQMSILLSFYLILYLTTIWIYGPILALFYIAHIDLYNLFLSYRFIEP